MPIWDDEGRDREAHRLRVKANSSVWDSSSKIPPLNPFNFTGEQYGNAITGLLRSFLTRTHLVLDRVEFEYSLGEPEQFATKLKVVSISSAILGPRDLKKSKLSDDQRQEYLTQTQILQGKQKQLGLETLSYIAREEKTASETKEEELTVQTPYRLWKRRLLLELHEALKERPDVIVFPEFGFPIPESEAFDLSPQSQFAITKSLHDFFDQVAKALSDHQAENPSAPIPMVFLGSYHCPVEFFNQAVIFPAGARRLLSTLIIEEQLSRTKVKIKKQRKSVQTPIVHRKFFPARRAGEKSRVPNEHQFLTFKNAKFRSGILICSDLMDVNQVMNMSRLSSLRGGSGARDSIDLIIVPAYNMSEILLDACRELSLLASCCVVYVNANSHFNEFPRSKTFAFGSMVDELRSFQVGPPKKTVIVNSGGRTFNCDCGTQFEGRIDWVELDLIELRKVQTKVRGALIEFLDLERTAEIEFDSV